MTAAVPRARRGLAAVLARILALATLRRAVAVVLVAIVLTRVGGFVVFNDIFAFDRTGTVHGSSAYLLYASNLMTTGVYGKGTPGVFDAHLPPLYSYVLAGWWSVTSGGVPSSWAVLVLHTLFDAVAAASLVFITTRLAMRAPIARLNAGAVLAGGLAGLMYAAYPYLLFQNLTLIDTPLFMALLYSFLASMVVLGNRAAGTPGRERFGRGGWAVALGAGVLLGLLGLTRPNGALFALAAGAWVLAQAGPRAGLMRLVPVGVVAALVLAPWLIACYRAYGQFVPVSLNGGENFYQGNNGYVVPFLRAGYDPQWVPPPDIPAFDDPFGPAANAARTAVGWDFLRTYPQAIPELLGWKLAVHWSIDIAPRRNPTEGELPRPDYIGDAVIEQGDAGLSIGALPPGDPVGQYSGGLFEQVGRPVHIAYFGGLLVFSLAGVWATRRGWRVLWLLYAVQAANTALYMVFHPSTRYRVPTDPLLFAFAAFALALLVVYAAERANLHRSS